MTYDREKTLNAIFDWLFVICEILILSFQKRNEKSPIVNDPSADSANFLHAAPTSSVSSFL